jgi:predicted LPLAT superfamily acyltransferase
LTVSGKTLPKTYIAITGEKSEYLIVPSDVGSFSQSVALVKGANTLRVVVYQEDGTHVEQTLTAVYTTAEL